MWFKILFKALQRNGWPQLFFYLSNLDVWRFLEYSQLLTWIKKQTSRGKIIDLGGGYSIFPSFFPKDDYTLYDISQNACEYQKKHGTKAVYADMTNLPIEDETISTIIAISSIEHVPDDSAVFGQIARILTSEGIAIISVPYSHKETRVRSLKRNKSMVTLLHKYSGFWKFLVGQSNMNYFNEQISTDSILKEYTFGEVERLLESNGLKLVDYRLLAKGSLWKLFWKVRPGWFIIKDMILGWPILILEKIFYRNSKEAGAIIFVAARK